MLKTAWWMSAPGRFFIKLAGRRQHVVHQTTRRHPHPPHSTPTIWTFWGELLEKDRAGHSTDSSISTISVATLLVLKSSKLQRWVPLREIFTPPRPVRFGESSTTTASEWPASKPVVIRQTRWCPYWNSINPANLSRLRWSWSSCFSVDHRVHDIGTAAVIVADGALRRRYWNCDVMRQQQHFTKVAQVAYMC